ncbi:MAG: alpha/beta hydrolase [Povalibacter sp.]
MSSAAQRQPNGEMRVIYNMKGMLKLLTVLLIATISFVGASTHAAELKDVSYGIDTAQQMDIYTPEHARAAPVILMVHGGAWRFGDKNSRGVITNKAQRWVPRGFIVISTNYRMLPHADVLEQAADVARALAYVQQHASEWGADRSRIILMGHSAGAHLVSLLTADPALATRYGAERWLGTVSLDSGAIDVATIMQRKHLPLYDQAFGADPHLWAAASPTQVLTHEALPLLAVCSSIRRDQPCKQTHEYAALAKAKRVRTEVLEQPLTHAQIDDLLGTDSAYTRAVEAFMSSLDPAIDERLR